jgi:23S rRNA (uridine2552-2'-O)-methyltransferase
LPKELLNIGVYSKLMSKQWLHTRKHDSYYKLAKAEGYRSRAAYKLKEIIKKFKVIRSGNIVLDLGAAPGGWSQVASELIGSNGEVIGIDLEPIEELNNKENNSRFLIGDITNIELVNEVKEFLHANKVDVVISDAAPNISGKYSIDQAKSIFLAEAVLTIAEKLLKNRGNMVIKIFQGEDFQAFNAKFKTHFRGTRIFSPKATRTRSSEIYIIGFGYKQQL